MAVTVIRHRAPAMVDRWMRHTAPVLSAEVERHFGRRLGPVEIVLTDRRGAVAMSTASVKALVPEATPAGITSEQRHKKRMWRDAAGCTAITLCGIQILVDGTNRRLRDSGPAALILAHELIHADQLGRPGVRKLMLQAMRHNTGVARDDHRAREINRLIDQHEEEAYRLEEWIARSAHN